MSKQVHVTYATKHGATAEFAKRIGSVLREEGLAADALPSTSANGAAKQLISSRSMPRPWARVTSGSSPAAQKVMRSN